MICDYVKNLGENHGVEISRDMIDYAICIADEYSSEMSNPGATIDFIEKSMIVAKRNKRDYVIKSDLNKNLDFDYHEYNRRS